MKRLNEFAGVVAVVACLAVVAIVAACGGPDPEPHCTDQNGVDAFCKDCCVVCETGKACGNACISASSTCHISNGCACDHK